MNVGGETKKKVDLTNGPGKLTKAFAITKEDYGLPGFQPPLFIAQGRIIKKIETGTRIGIENSGEARNYLWRFWEKNNPFISRK